MKLNCRMTLVALSVAALMTGCATGTRSDSLGLTQKEGVKTYAEAYMPARDMLNAGQFDELKAKILQNAVDKDGNALPDDEAYEKLIEGASELSMMERGLIALNTGDFKRALFFFDAAEEKLNLTEENAGIGDKAGSLAKTGAAKLIGMAELADYEVKGYEKVMLLNYKALCHMLMGDRKAYNVTRRAIDLQQAEWEKFQEEKAKFDEKMEKAKAQAKEAEDKKAADEKAKLEAAKKEAEAAKKQAEEAKQNAMAQAAKSSLLGFLPGGLGAAAQSAQMAATAADTVTSTLDSIVEIMNIFAGLDIDDRSKAVVKKANLVTSAYVNPFADYMNGLLQEFDSLEDPALRDNARISYEKVVANNKDCTAAKTAQKAVMKGIGSNQKLVQVILSDGFAPYQVEKQRNFQVGKYHATVNLSNATPVETPVVSARVKVNGKPVKMSSLTKMESIIFRDEQDRLPWRTFDVATALVRSGIANEKLGVLGDMVTSNLQHPDTRSWLSLPNQVLVSRIVVPAGQKTIEIQTLGKGGKPLVSSKVELADHGPTLVYAVNYGTHMKTYANAFSWVN